MQFNFLILAKIRNFLVTFLNPALLANQNKRKPRTHAFFFHIFFWHKNLIVWGVWRYFVKELNILQCLKEDSTKNDAVAISKPSVNKLNFVASQKNYVKTIQLAWKNSGKISLKAGPVSVIVLPSKLPKILRENNSVGLKE